MKISPVWPVALLAAVVVARMRTRRRSRLGLGSGTEDRTGLTQDDLNAGFDEPEDDNFDGPALEDLSNWKRAIYIWGSGLPAAAVGYFFGYWLAGEHDANLLRLVGILVSSSVMLISASIVAITLTGDWNITPRQAQRRNDLIVSSAILAVFAVIGIAFAGFYAAIAPESEESPVLGTYTTEWVGGLTVALLTLSLFGIINHIFRIVRLIHHQTRLVKDGPPASER